MHKDFMLAALEQARLGQGSCAPNPSVGAVLVHNGDIIARAWHRGAGTAHAEQLVLEQLPANLQNVSLYVTLEPCNHWGKTPPCVAAITEYGISQVIYGFRDPNPLVAANNTPEILHENGIQSLHYPLQEIDEFYRSYSYWTRTRKPWVTVKLAQSFDGKIAGKQGQRYQLSNADCAEFTHRQRLNADVILTTAKTINQDNPLLNVRLADNEQAKVVAIIDNHLSLDNKAKIFSTAKHCHIYHDQCQPVITPIINCSYHPMPVKEGLLDLAAVINHLGYLGFHDVWVEAGGRLFSSLHKNNLVQQTYLYLVPILLGTEATSAFTGEIIFTTKPKVTWQIKADNVIACLEWESSCLQD